MALAASVDWSKTPLGKIENWPRSLQADPDRIFQLLENLISNALKFSPRESEVSLSLQVSDGRVLLPGSQVGMGLGLYIAKSIAQEHGGDIAVKAEPGKGSTFIASLPMRG